MNARDDGGLGEVIDMEKSYIFFGYQVVIVDKTC